MIRVVGKSKLPELAEMGEAVELSPEELAEYRRQNAAFERNRERFSANARSLYKQYAGTFICVARGEVFAGEDAKDVYARSYAAHPVEKGVGYGIYIRANQVETDSLLLIRH